MGHKVAFIGLGVMGFPMAGHLANAGHQVTVYNRSPEKASSWANTYPGTTAATPAAAVEGADFIFSCVGNDEDLRSVTTGEDGAFANVKPGAIFIDNTTTSAEIARELSEVASNSGFIFLDAPVSGGQAGAENGKLTVMMGGDEAAFNTAKPVIEAFAANVQLIGPSGYGQLCKMVNQLCIAGVVQGLSEGIHFAKRAELDIEKVISVISKGAAQSWQMENRYKTMTANEFEFGFAVDWMRKDLGIALQEAEKNGASLPVTKIVDGYYAQIQKNGGNRWDTSSLLTLLEDK
ncbi:MAG: oxidoreductase [SAR86 cluster bacterium]|uniref:Oxidoreductase n=1 Tax=SAR86 cluster bacterium TaxID=2030880 RepID=A0A2A5CG07_9GAMM|nr:MAG: oxidoreductase [SAR86 cluster bacterium]